MKPSNFDGGFGRSLAGGVAVIAANSTAAGPIKTPVRLATTGAITIATGLNAGDTIDGVTLAAGDRVLVWQQAAAAENGIYQAGTTPARTLDFDSSAEIVGAFVSVLEGTDNAGAVYRNTNTVYVVVDTDDITFELWPPSVDAAIEAAIASWEHVHVVNLAFSGDGATTAFELPASPVDEFSAAAYVAGVRVPVTLSGAILTTMTFGSAPASGTDNITVDIVAVLT